MTIQKVNCPYCGKRVEVDPGQRRDDRLCPFCQHSLNAALQAPGGYPAPADVGQEIPELSPSHGMMRMVRSTALAICVVSIVLCALLLFQMLGSVQPGVLALVAIIALGSAFVWFYTQFAITLKSGPR